MTRCCTLLILMLLSSPACAGDSFSFSVGGHRIHIEAPRNCRSTSCVSVSIPGVYERRKRDWRDDNDVTAAAAPEKPAVAAPEPAPVRPAVAPPATPAVAPVAKAAAEPVVTVPPPVKPVDCAVQATSAPRPPATPPTIAPVAPAPVAPPPPPVVIRPAPYTAPPISRVSHEADDEPAETALGDWQTEANKGAVRIERCGRALCGYVLHPESNSVGESVLINMKPTSASQWSGNIYSHDSKNTYYATIAIKGPNALRVEACAFGRFFCSGNVWSRIAAKPERLITSSQIATEPRS